MIDPTHGDPNPASKSGSWGLKSTANNDTAYITDCKLCRFGVYKGQLKVWGTGIGLPIGWSHQECADARQESP